MSTKSARSAGDRAWKTHLPWEPLASVRNTKARLYGKLLGKDVRPQFQVCGLLSVHVSILASPFSALMFVARPHNQGLLSRSTSR